MTYNVSVECGLKNSVLEDCSGLTKSTAVAEKPRDALHYLAIDRYALNP